MDTDTRVTFTDEAGIEWTVDIPRQGHTDREVRTVAYRWACKQIASGEWRPYGELRYVRIARHSGLQIVNGAAI